MTREPRLPECRVPAYGFTLVEVLIVLFIFGLIGVVTSLRSGISPGARLDDESDRFRQVIETSLDRSRLIRDSIVLRAGPDRYSISIREGGVERQVAERDLGQDVKLLSLWIEGRSQAPPFELTLSGRNPTLFRIRMGSVSGELFDLRSTLLGRVEKVQAIESK